MILLPTYTFKESYPFSYVHFKYKRIVYDGTTPFPLRAWRVHDTNIQSLASDSRYKRRVK